MEEKVNDQPFSIDSVVKYKNNCNINIFRKETNTNRIIIADSNHATLNVAD